ncbi:MAG TPA: allantoate amidohydrolase [Amnibacterium sp.]|uniref:allantoate amidohydrolase n=1 Tax=Amnibacterium sp. TaxID=1872496 RepID=UPI002F94F3C8
MSRIGRLLETLAPIGRNEQGGYDRLAWTDADAGMRRWFLAEAASLGLETEVDRNGNLWAHWRRQPGGGLVVGSHLDSVPNGGALDGPLGVASAFAAIRSLKEAGETPASNVAVVAFVDEEGGRFGIACLGSRLMTGALDPDRARALTDREGVRLDDAMRAAGLDPDGLGPDPVRVASITAAVELHVEQGHLPIDGSDAAGLTAADAPLGVLTGIWPHGRWRIDVVGQADHAGTTPMADRDDPVVGAAAVVLAAREAAILEGALATVGRVEVEPGAVNAIAARASLWLDVRGADEGRIRRVVDRIAAAAGVDPVQESWTASMRFARSETRRIAAAVREVTGSEAPALPSGAGHDAGVLQAAGVAAAMLAVRNPTGVSHAPGESADLADIEVGVAVLARLLAGFPASGTATA